MTRTPRVLVVDDVPDITELFCHMLSRVGGYETRAANTGLEAIRIAEEFRPDFILLDLGMPNVNGFETARRIREEVWSKGILFIAMSGCLDGQYACRAREAGFKEYLSKPMSVKTIIDAIERFSHGRFDETSRNLPAICSPLTVRESPLAGNHWPVRRGLYSVASKNAVP